MVSAGHASGLLLLVATVYQLWKWTYNIFFHPLSKVPGPRLWAASRFPHEFHLIRGDLHTRLRDLHDQYGDVVRTSPNGLSFVHPEAWKDIMVKQHPGAKIPVKDMLRFTDALKINGAPEMLTADDKTHARQRRLLSHAFSQKALNEKSQVLVKQHINVLMEQLAKRAGEKIDITKWVSLTTFDVIADLSFGRSFGCLETGEYHPWTKLIFECVFEVTVLGSLRQFPWMYWFLDKMISKTMTRMLLDHQKLVVERVKERLESKTDREDFLSEIIKHNGTGKEMSNDEIMSNMNVLVPAGSESTMEVTIATMYLILSHPDVLKRLVEEVRSTFADESQISFESTQDLKYLNACLNESMRVHPPVPIHNPRRGNPQGSMVQGVWVTHNMTLGMYHFPAYRSRQNFTNPELFDPSRWLGNVKYQSDRREVVQPFGFGSRNCIGKHLALSEIRTMLCHIVLAFDVELCDESRAWTDQKAWWTWAKVPLWVVLKART
ncbi:Nn.00g094290.m01.CDS01 [Neocucurbitaria sp. VM-36]